MAILDDLQRYYANHGILATRFACPHKNACRGNSERFTGPKSAYVGECYENAHACGLPRLVFVSLDSGSAEANPMKRLPEAVRHETISGCLGPKNRHWYRTHELGACIFNRILGTCMTPRQAQPYFAHANSAKCCQNKPGRRQADRRLFENCRRYLPGELDLLRPDVIVTQGNPAKSGLASVVGFSPPKSRFTTRARLGEREVFWLHTYHPAAFGWFYRQRQRWGEFADEIKVFVDEVGGL